jgi:hypothetical protein
MGIRHELTHYNDQSPKVIVRILTGIEHPLFDRLPEAVLDGVIQKGIFIGEVGVKRGAVDACQRSYILHVDRLKSFEADQFEECPLNALMGANYPGINFFFRQHFHLVVA